MSEGLTKKVETFFAQYKKQIFTKGEILIRADNNPLGIFYLKKGTVKEYAISTKGDEIIVNIFKPSAFFPMSWAMNGTPNSYFFEAMEDLEVWRAPKEKVIEFIKNEPDVLYDLLSRVYKGTDGLLTRMAYLMAGNAYGQLVIELIIFAKRFQKNEQKSIELEISETDLASQTGMTRETVSRKMKILKERTLITYTNGKLIIPDLLKLEKELSEDFNGLSS